MLFPLIRLIAAFNVILDNYQGLIIDIFWWSMNLWSWVIIYLTISAGDLGSSKNLRKLAETHPKAKGILLYKAEIQDRKHEILSNEDEYLKVLNIVDQVLSHIEEQLKTQVEGLCLIFITLNKIKPCELCFN